MRKIVVKLYLEVVKGIKYLKIATSKESSNRIVLEFAWTTMQKNSSSRNSFFLFRSGGYLHHSDPTN